MSSSRREPGINRRTIRGGSRAATPSRGDRQSGAVRIQRVLQHRHRSRGNLVAPRGDDDIEFTGAHDFPQRTFGNVFERALRVFNFEAVLDRISTTVLHDHVDEYVLFIGGQHLGAIRIIRDGDRVDEVDGLNGKWPMPARA